MELRGDAGLIQTFKPQLIEAVQGDPDFLLQHCHASRLLTQKEYSHVKACVVPWEKARDLLDYVMNKDVKRLRVFMNLLQKEEMQETYPKLAFLNDVAQGDAKGNKRKQKSEEKHDDVPTNKMCKLDGGGGMVTEKQLMMVARNLGVDWKEVGRVALEIPSVQLEQIDADNKHSHRERVFCMLRRWSTREKEKATAAHLHSLLTQEDFGVAAGSIDFLLEERQSPL